MISFKVINWDFNGDEIEHYDIMPYLYNCLKKKKVKKSLITYEWLKSFIDKESMYMFWSRCEYETIVTGWPQRKREHKMDVYEQIKMNLDNITKLMYDDLKNSTPRKSKTVSKSLSSVEMKPVKAKIPSWS